jgi:hypothetical protein
MPTNSRSFETSSPPSRELWSVDDSSFNSYVDLVRFQRGFAKDLILERIDNDSTNVVLDIAGGSNGVAVRNLIDSELFGEGIFTNYVDNRSEETRQSNVGFVAGDLRTSETWEALLSWQQYHAPDGFALVLHRPAGGLQDLCDDDYIKYTRTIMSMIKPGGLFYSQVPSHPLRPRSESSLQTIREGIRSIEGVVGIEVSDSAATLSDYQFCIISK